MKHPDPQAQALALLRAELDHLQRHALAPTQQAIIRRLIARAVELRPIFEQVWNPAHLRPTRASGSTSICTPKGTRSGARRSCR